MDFPRARLSPEHLQELMSENVVLSDGILLDAFRPGTSDI